MSPGACGYLSKNGNPCNAVGVLIIRRCEPGFFFMPCPHDATPFKNRICLRALRQDIVCVKIFEVIAFRRKR